MRLTYEDKASIKLDRHQKNINPIDYAVWGAVQQDVYRIPIVGLEDLKDRMRTCWASLDQQQWSTKHYWSVETEIENCS